MAHAQPVDWPADWLKPDWPAPPGVRALFTTRAGGVSAPPFDRFNLGDHVRDEPAAVAENRARLGRWLGGPRPVFLRQVHGSAVARLDRATPDGTEADACIARAPGVACTIMVADCLPVLFTDLAGTVVGAAHAGWRGLAGPEATSGQGVLEATFDAFAVAVGGRSPVAGDTAGVAGRTLAWLGPCIGPQAFEVGAEVRAAFVGQDPQAEACFVPLVQPGQFLANLPALARRRLQALGITRIAGNDGSAPWCTVGNASRFFSHRRDAARLGSTGRMAACIWLD